MNNFCSLECQCVDRQSRELKKDEINKEPIIDTNENKNFFFNIDESEEELEKINPINWLAPTLFLTQLYVLTNAIN